VGETLVVEVKYVEDLDCVVSDVAWAGRTAWAGSVLVAAPFYLSSVTFRVPLRPPTKSGGLEGAEGEIFLYYRVPNEHLAVEDDTAPSRW
jgi:hypothetical protein